MLLLACLAAAACVGGGQVADGQAPNWTRVRDRMVREVLEPGGIRDPRVLQSMRTTPRHEFVQPQQRALAYVDMALPIGESQTISGIFVVAYMTEQLQPEASDRVLEIGTGSGYQAAVLAELARGPFWRACETAAHRRSPQGLSRLCRRAWQLCPRAMRKR